MWRNVLVMLTEFNEAIRQNGPDLYHRLNAVFWDLHVPRSKQDAAILQKDQDRPGCRDLSLARVPGNAENRCRKARQSPGDLGEAHKSDDTSEVGASPSSVRGHTLVQR